MTLSETGLSYRRSAIQGASTIGLIITMFDTLAGNLSRAANAIRKNDIETRCRELNHAALVLGQLQSWIDLKNGGESAQTLSRFYAYLRTKMMEASVSRSAKLLETQIDMILHVRSAWQLLDASQPQAAQGTAEVTGLRLNTLSASPQEPSPERIPFSQSA
jgi:flagellar protein FliS